MARVLKKKPELTRAQLDEQVEAFLKNGGTIEKIPSGKTGIEQQKGPRHIKISNK